MDSSAVLPSSASSGSSPVRAAPAAPAAANAAAAPSQKGPLLQEYPAAATAAATRGSVNNAGAYDSLAQFSEVPTFLDDVGVGSQSVDAENDYNLSESYAEPNPDAGAYGHAGYEAATLAAGETPLPGSEPTFIREPAKVRRSVLCLILVYTGYYFCRTDLSVSLPSLTTGAEGKFFTSSMAGSIISYGYFSYAFGKLFNGFLLNRFGPRKVLHICLYGSILSTLLLSTLKIESDSDIKSFGVLWSVNRFFQSGGWPAIILFVRSMFPRDQHGRILGFASLSFSLGDAVIRLFLGQMLKLGIHWQTVFLLSALCSVVLSIPSLLYIHAPRVLRQRNAHAELQNSEIFANSGSRLKPQFWVLLVQSPLSTWLRELMLSWIVLMLHDLFFAESAGDATIISVVLPLLGALSSVAGGIIIDSYSSHPRRMQKRARLYLTLMLLTLVSDICLADAIRARWLPGAVALLGAKALFASAPASWAEGLFLFDVSRPQDSGLVVGAIHCAGYLGAILAGAPVGDLAGQRGWLPVFALSILVSVANMVLTLVYFLLSIYEQQKMTSAAAASSAPTSASSISSAGASATSQRRKTAAGAQTTAAQSGGPVYPRGGKRTRLLSQDFPASESASRSGTGEGKSDSNALKSLKEHASPASEFAETPVQHRKLFSSCSKENP